MKGLVYALLGAMELEAFGEVSVKSLARVDERLLEARSGLSATVFARGGDRLWQSPSHDVRARRRDEYRPRTGEWLFEAANESTGNRFILTFGIEWHGQANEVDELTVLVTEDTTAYEAELNIFRRSLGFWVASAFGALLLIQYSVLSWGLRPLRHLTDELRIMARGERSEIQGQYPEELAPLVNGLNSVLQHEKAQLLHYRHSLDDLAHGLKTPISALRALVAHSNDLPEAGRAIEEQIARIDELVTYQLHKASTVGRPPFSEQVALRPIAEKIVTGLSKVYREKGAIYELEMDTALQVHVEESDLMEILGALLDNASKWCTHRVRVCARTRGELGVDLFVDDDGPGFPPGIETDHLLQRGVRADSRTPGQGLGLAIVHNLVGSYGGTIELSQSPLGGARVRIELL